MLDKFFKEHEEEAKKALENMDVKEDDLQSVLYLQLYYVYPHIDLLASIGNINVPVFKQTLGKLAGALSDKFNTAYTYINPAMYMETGVLDYPDNKVQSYMLETGYGSYATDINMDDYFLDASNNVNQEDYMVQCSNDDGWTLPVSTNTFEGLKVVSSYGKRNKDYISEASSQEVQAFLNQARSYLGKYTYSQLDCSGYARAVLRDMGIDFPRISASKFLNKDQPWWKYVKAYRDVRESGGDPLEGIKPGDIIVMIKGVNGYATNLSITGHIAINVGMDKENGVNRGNNVMYHSTIGRTGNGPTQGVISDTYKNATGWIRFFDAGPVENDAEIDPNNWEYSPTLEFTSSTVNRPIVGSMSKASVISTGTTQEGHAYVVTKQADSSGNDKYLVYEGLDPATLRVEKGDVLKPGTELGISAGSVVKVYSPKDPTTQLVTDSQELSKFNNVLEVIHPDIAKKLHSKFTEGAKKAEQKESSNKVNYNTSGEVFSKEAVCEIPDTYTGTITKDIIMMEGYPWMSQMSSIPNEYQNIKIYGKSKTYLQNGCGGWANAMGLTKALGRPIHVNELEGGFLKTDLVMDGSLMSRFLNNNYGSEIIARASSSSNFRNSQNEIIEALNSGGYAVIHSRPPDKTWTRRPSGTYRDGGHYVVLIGYDPENHPDKPFRVHDSANNNPSNTGWFTWEQVKAGAVGGSNMIVRKK
ncbi:C39 family peptidase [Peptoniphilus timonensis]|uniref:C39 family peptidase n=1 Tax=Peptoniphilus timonensis TaxID=1268254 RepID=UPI0002E9EC9B|nr:C39 family peptidase [Peptoniphilus timonensis]